MCVLRCDTRSITTHVDDNNLHEKSTNTADITSTDDRVTQGTTRSANQVLSEVQEVTFIGIGVY